MISVGTADGAAFSYTETFTVDVEASDDLSGVHAVDITLDGEEVTDGTTVELGGLALGEHVLAVTARTSRNRSTSQVTFTVRSTGARSRTTSPTSSTSSS
ncbi:Ig-like domain-containing protein [Georgenia sp. SUBG003]|uniref:Ig-like domain-containing protein n=1 Tax=Georgenia sp. SUBG003 TaxID=1497974 RepID=UPI003AB74DB5